MFFVRVYISRGLLSYGQLGSSRIFGWISISGSICIP
jgi:hypothetical protein